MTGTHDHGGIERDDLVRIAGVSVVAALVWFHVWEPFRRISVLGLAGTIGGGWPIYHEAWENVRSRRMTMELSMTIALAAALVIGEFFAALVITLFVLIAEVLEGLTVGRGRRAIHDLLRFLPSTATVRRSTGVLQIPAAELCVGDIVLIAPGERLPVDGTVRSGHSFVDQAPITGESIPVEKAPGDVVYAGTMNQSGALELCADRLGAETSFGKIIEAVEHAETSRAPVQRAADRYAGYLVYFALVCAALTFAITHDTRSTISVIIVAGACGIAAGTPLAILGGIGRAARAGAIVKGGRYLEALWNVDLVAFDKTGTVTVGRPVVCDIRAVSGVSTADVLAAAATAERPSEHPLGRAIVRAAEAWDLRALEPDGFEYTPGQGILATTAHDRIVVGSERFLALHNVPVPSESSRHCDAAAVSEVLVGRGTRYLGTIGVADALRDEARASVEALRRMGIRSMLLTGDTAAAAAAIASQLRVDGVRAELLPEQKVLVLEHLADKGHYVAMVGDGVNDAPALITAAVGVAMGGGTDVARESADIVLLGNDLLKFVEVVRIAHQARRIIQFNFAGTLAVDAVGVGLAAAGLLNPLLAAFIHVASELAFILNSARLLPRGPSQAPAYDRASGP